MNENSKDLEKDTKRKRGAKREAGMKNDVIREIIRYAMKKRKVKQIDLANNIGIGKSLMSSYFSGRYGLSQEVLVKAFKYLGIWFSMDGMMFDEEGQLIEPGVPEDLRESDETDEALEPDTEDEPDTAEGSATPHPTL